VGHLGAGSHGRFSAQFKRGGGWPDLSGSLELRHVSPPFLSSREGVRSNIYYLSDEYLTMSGVADKDAGNEWFKKGEFLKAAASYTKVCRAARRPHYAPALMCQRSRASSRASLPTHCSRCDAGDQGGAGQPRILLQPIAGLPQALEGSQGHRGCRQVHCNRARVCQGLPPQGVGTARDGRRSED
jgi:hypothetical protein